MSSLRSYLMAFFTFHPLISPIFKIPLVKQDSYLNCDSKVLTRHGGVSWNFISFFLPPLRLYAHIINRSEMKKDKLGRSLQAQ